MKLSSSVDRPRVALVLTGGTITSIGSSRLDLAHYADTGRRLSGKQLLGRYPEVAEQATIELVEAAQAQSAALGPSDWVSLAHRIDQLFRADGYDSVIVAYGTSTLEEAAYFVDLTVPDRDRVIFTGAMRPPTGMGTEAGLNLVQAVAVARSAQQLRLGTLVVMNGSVFGARDVTKGATHRAGAFHAPDSGPLGTVDADLNVWIRHRPAADNPVQPATIDQISQLPRVDIVASYAGADRALVDAAVAAGARGIVSAGSGAGRVTGSEDEALHDAARAGVVICRSTRVGSGHVLRSRAMRDIRFVAAGDLAPWKARVLLMTTLTRTSDTESIQTAFDNA